MAMVLKVKWDVFRCLCKERAKFVTSMGITHFVEYIGVSTRHIGNYEICRFDLTIDPLQDCFGKTLFVNPLGNYVAFRRDSLNAKPIYVVECIVERHQNERERFSGQVSTLPYD